jgi:hypothetical protein
MKRRLFNMAGMLVLILAFGMMIIGCASFWEGFAEGYNSSAANSSSSPSSSSSISAPRYNFTLYNDSSTTTITVYAEGQTYIIPPNSSRTHSSNNSVIDWYYEPSNFKAYPGINTVRFNH